MPRIVARSVPTPVRFRLEREGVHPLLARLYAGRGVSARDELDYRLQALLDPGLMKGAAEAGMLLADAVQAGRRLLVVADYDCDGATACAVAVRGLRALGAAADYLVPNRFEDGYGLTPEIVRQAQARRPDILVTVDNGIASLEGVAEARRAGMATLVTDHHLPGDALPEAHAIVNPNQPGCAFPSKSLAGVGVMFYAVLATRAELRRRGWFAARAEPNLAGLLDLVALGTVADVVRLDRNNRLLVSQGLARIREGRACAGVRALLHVAGRDPARASTFDLGFAAGPRINAAGRLADMSLGIECLITDDFVRALNIAQQLDELNRARRAREAEMQEQAGQRLESLSPGDRASLALYEPGWHQGIVGLLAGRLKERLHRPVICFAPAGDGSLRGSGRSIPGLHLRDALDLVAKRFPGLLLRFGGHAAAAGLTLREADLAHFAAAFEQVAVELIDPADLAQRVDTDGPLESGYMSLESVRLIEADVWGQGFPAPLFSDDFQVESQRVLKDRHLKLRLRRGAERIEAIAFNRSEAAPARVHAAYRVGINEYQGLAGLQLVIEHLEPA